MYELLITVVIAEAAVASLLLLKIGPLRKLVLKILDQLKMGLGPVTVKGIAGTMGVILLSKFISIVKMQNKGEMLGTMSPMDQVLYRTHILEASLICMILLPLLSKFHCFGFSSIYGICVLVIGVPPRKICLTELDLVRPSSLDSVENMMGTFELLSLALQFYLSMLVQFGCAFIIWLL
jgi:hypothetical protein